MVIYFQYRLGSTIFFTGCSPHYAQKYNLKEKIIVIVQYPT